MADKLKVVSAVSTLAKALVENGGPGLMQVVGDGFELISMPDPTFLIALFATEFTLDVVHSIWQWYGGAIDGWRCAANIQSATFRCAGGLFGGIAGMTAFGMFLGPSTLALVAGGFIGATYGGFKGLQLADILNRLFFGLPSNVALQLAYDAFGVSCNATVPEVNKAYRNYCRQHHPDKGGDNDEFVRGQFYMEIIRADRMGKEKD